MQQHQAATVASAQYGGGALYLFPHPFLFLCQASAHLWKRCKPTNALTHTRTHSNTHTNTLTHSHNALTHALTHSNTQYEHTYTLTNRTHSTLTHSNTQYEHTHTRTQRTHSHSHTMEISDLTRIVNSGAFIKKIPM